MHRVFNMCLDAAIAAVFLIPVFWLLDRHRFHDSRRTAGYLILAIYLAGLYAVVGLPDIRYIRFAANINLVPFAYMFSDYKSTSLNVLLFLPLGFLLPVLWAVFGKVYWTVLFGFCTSLLIELLQLFTFRATDVNDLMTNTLGAALGWCLGRIFLRLAPGVRPGTQTKDVYLVFGLTFGIMFFLQPFLADLAGALFFR